jgi:uncharacterized small protein (DUF1192 family)
MHLITIVAVVVVAMEVHNKVSSQIKSQADSEQDDLREEVDQAVMANATLTAQLEALIQEQVAQIAATQAEIERVRSELAEQGSPPDDCTEVKLVHVQHTACEPPLKVVEEEGYECRCKLRERQTRARDPRLKSGLDNDENIFDECVMLRLQAAWKLTLVETIPAARLGNEADEFNDAVEEDIAKFHDTFGEACETFGEACVNACVEAQCVNASVEEVDACQQSAAEPGKKCYLTPAIDRLATEVQKVQDVKSALFEATALAMCHHIGGLISDS